ncbi:MAG: hypothetical protein V1753_02530, partial [Pseudomonadota bacterium]
MKKLSVLAVALGIALAIGIPAMATEVEFSGSYEVQGFLMTNQDLNDIEESDGQFQDFMNMSFELETVFKATDTLSVTTRFDALEDKVWGADAEDGDSPQFDRLYMTADFIEY